MYHLLENLKSFITFVYKEKVMRYGLISLLVIEVGFRIGEIWVMVGSFLVFSHIIGKYFYAKNANMSDKVISQYCFVGAVSLPCMIFAWIPIHMISELLIRFWGVIN
jgi:hypothetical protein